MENCRSAIQRPSHPRWGYGDKSHQNRASRPADVIYTRLRMDEQISLIDKLKTKAA